MTFGIDSDEKNSFRENLKCCRFFFPWWDLTLLKKNVGLDVALWSALLDWSSSDPSLNPAEC